VSTERVSESERLRRWRLVLGGGEGDGTGVELSGDDAGIDNVLGVLYDTAPRPEGGGRTRSGAGGLGRSAPGVARWLGDIRRYFPTPIVQVLQRDAIERLDLRRLLLEPEMLAAVEPDIDLVTTLVELNHLLPDETRETARHVVASVLDTIREQLEDRTRAAVAGALARAERSRRPRPADVDWHRTIHANLRHWLPEHRTVVPERLVGFGRRSRSLQRDVIVAIDQSASMADSIVYASVFGAVLAGIPALRTQLVVFDTAVVDLSDMLDDPVDVLFGVQLGGGTDVGAALAYCRQLVTRPRETMLIVITDLFDGGPADRLHALAADLVGSGVTLVILLSLSDEGSPTYDRSQAAALRALGATVFACTPDLAPTLLAKALDGSDVAEWAASIQK
jgi:Mg-chelatase subunit ChlD